MKQGFRGEQPKGEEATTRRRSRRRRR